MGNPKLSIITINLNNSFGLRRTIESVINQTFDNYEYIIIDGGSTDGSVEVIKEFADRITYWVSEPDKGIYNAMNKGILKAKGEYLQFLNSGDWLVDNTITERSFSEIKTADIIYGDLIFWYSEKNQKVISFKNRKISTQFFYEASLGHPATFISRKLFERKLYDEGFKIVSDWKFFLEKIVLESCSIDYINKPLVYFDMHGLSEMKDMKKFIEQERQTVLQSLFSPLILSDLKELHDLKHCKPVVHILEIQKYNLLSFIINGCIKISLSGLLRLRRMLTYKFRS